MVFPAVYSIWKLLKGFRNSEICFLVAAGQCITANESAYFSNLELSLIEPVSSLIHVTNMQASVTREIVAWAGQET
jgi:hypothetical protein